MRPFILSLFLFLFSFQSAYSASKPLVGITTGYYDKEFKGIKTGEAKVDIAYVDDVIDAGGIPILIPSLKLDDKEILSFYVEALDALVLTGGPDVPPQAYGETPHETVKPMHKRRFISDLLLTKAWLKTNKPILGICLGSQLVNVAMGGTLIQDIPSQVRHCVNHRRSDVESFHSINITPGTKLREILGSEKVKVNSNHHQAVKNTGKGLKVSARSSDGIVEATEIPKKPFAVFVQWHPERMVEDQDQSQRLFNAFIDAAKQGSGTNQ